MSTTRPDPLRDFTDIALDAQLDTFFLFEPASGRALRWNRAFRETSGYTDEEIARLPAPATYYGPEDLERAAEFIERVLEQGTGTIELELICKDGRRVPTEYRVSVIRDEDGAPTAIISIGRDVTERRRLESRLALITHAIENSLNGFDIVDENGTFLYVNQAYVDMWGYASAVEIIGTSPVEHCVDPDMPHRIIAELKSTGRFIGEFEARRKDGSVFDVLMYARLDRDEHGAEIYVGTSIDVTERKRAERSLRESERRLATLMKNLPGMAYRCVNDADWTMEFLSEGVERVTGYPAEALVGSRDRTYGGLIHTDDAEMVWRTVQEAIAKSGDFRMEYRIRDREGRERWVSEQGRVSEVRTGGEVVLEGYITDISELRDLETQLQQARKMEAVGRLAGGVAHDFNNILTVINNYCDLILCDLAEGEDLHGDVTSMKRAALRATDLTRQLLAFSRKQLIRPQVVDVNETVHRSEEMLRRMIGEDVEIVIDATADSAHAWFDPGQLDQILFNLAANARDAMPDGGRLTLATRGPKTCPALPGDFIELTVRDTGLGMDAATLRNIFEPFYTTKAVGKGTGLGLATVYGIVKQHGGAIDVESGPGEGTAFRIYLPTAKREPQAASTVMAESAPRGAESILLVEDEEAVRKVAMRILEAQGYAVRAAADAAEALEYVASTDAPIDLVLTDVVMPGMSGVDCARRLLELRPDLRILFMSGHTEDAIAHHGVLDPGTPFIQKPFTATELAREVRELLDRR